MGLCEFKKQKEIYMVKVEQVFFINATPKKVATAMRNYKMIEESEKSRDTLEVEIRELKKTKTHHEFEIHTVNYARGVTGIDKIKTEKSYSHQKWDLDALTGEWVWHGPHGPRVKVTGSNSLTPEGKGTNVTMQMQAEIGVPLVGKTIEKKVAKGFKDAWPNYIKVVEKWTKKK
jgi:Protein of unknown function (DUF2505)